MEKTKEALDNLPKSTQVHLSIVGLDNDLSDSEICMVDTNITAGSEGTPDERLLQEFAQGHIIRTFRIGFHCSMQVDHGVLQFRNVLPKKVLTSSAIVNQIIPLTPPQKLQLPMSGIVLLANLNHTSGKTPFAYLQK